MILAKTHKQKHRLGLYNYYKIVQKIQIKSKFKNSYPVHSTASNTKST